MSRHPRNKQILKAYNWLIEAKATLSVMIKAGNDPVEMTYQPAQWVDIYPEQLELYKSIYGDRVEVLA